MKFTIRHAYFINRFANGRSALLHPQKRLGMRSNTIQIVFANGRSAFLHPQKCYSRIKVFDTISNFVQYYFKCWNNFKVWNCGRYNSKQFQSLKLWTLQFQIWNCDHHHRNSSQLPDWNCFFWNCYRSKTSQFPILELLAIFCVTIPILELWPLWTPWQSITIPTWK